ncbi:MAG: GxxExxY protein [Candidatus Aureabacteria bacterium]|nr:GxxExxY protein [Candidatus Auribacterota bacterium]
MTDELTGKIIGAAIEVHKTLGPGLLDSVYEEALCHEFVLRGIRFERQIGVDIVYKGHPISGQRLDLLVEGEVVVELKSLHSVPEVATSQVLSYLRATGRRRGLIINFGELVLVDGIKRISL